MNSSMLDVSDEGSGWGSTPQPE